MALEADIDLFAQVPALRLLGPNALRILAISAETHTVQAGEALFHQGEDAVFTIGPYTFRPGAKMLVTERNSKIRLTEKETAILRYLYRAGKKPVAREILLQEVWGYNSGVTTHTLETHIYRLRQKIEKDPSNALLLVTEAGGYKLVP